MSDLPEKIRAFIAVPIPGEVIAQLVSAQKRLQGELAGVSWTRPESMHVTLQFLGDIESARLPELEAALRQAAGPAASFEMELAGLGSFGNRVVWAGIVRGAEPLGELARAIRLATKGLAGHEEERPFNAHVTLGRVRQPDRGMAKALRQAGVPSFGSWRVDRFELLRSEMSSAGARHTVLASFAF